MVQLALRAVSRTVFGTEDVAAATALHDGIGRLRPDVAPGPLRRLPPRPALRDPQGPVGRELRLTMRPVGLSAGTTPGWGRGPFPLKIYIPASRRFGPRPP